MIRKQITQFFISLLLTACAFGQNTSAIDSLEALLKTAREDTVKVICLNSLSKLYSNISKPGKAMQCADSALALAGKINYKKGAAYALSYRGRVFHDTGNENEALDCHMKALKLREEIGDQKSIASTYGSLGNIYIVLGNYPEALKNYIASLAIFEKVGELRGSAISHNNVGTVYFKQGDYADALTSFNASLKIRQAIGDKGGIADCYFNIASVYIQQSNYPEALNNLQSALVIFKEIGDRRRVATTYNNLGTICFDQGFYPEALKYHNLSLEIKEQVSDKVGTAESYENIGAVYGETGDYPEALKYFFKALAICEETGYKSGIIAVRLNCGHIYEKQGNYSDALKNFRTALEISQENGEKDQVASSYNSIGTICLLQKNYPDALKNYSLALEINEETGQKKAIALTSTNMGTTYLEQGKYTDAMKSLSVAINISKETGDRMALARAYIKSGELKLRLKKFEEARACFEDALLISRKIGNKVEIGRSYKGLSETDSAEGKLSQALGHYKMYTCYKDSLLNEESNRATAQIRIRYETEKKEREIEMLNKDNDIKSLYIKEQKASLLASTLEAESRKSQILLMGNSYEIQQLKLTKAESDLEHQKAEGIVKSVHMELLVKEKELREHQLERQKLVRNGMFAGTGLLVLLGLLFFRSWHLRKKLEKQQAILQERTRISADLHDDIGTGLSKISLLSELVINDSNPKNSKKEVEKIADTSRDLLESISEIIWALNTKNDYLENLVAYIRRYASEYFENSHVKLTLRMPGEIPQLPISGDCRRNIFNSVKEALHNIVKHAHASEAEIVFTLTDNLFTVVIRDNGMGIPEGERNRFGNGVRNMRNRMETIQGNFAIENHDGTKVTLALPV